MPIEKAGLVESNLTLPGPRSYAVNAVASKMLLARSGKIGQGRQDRKGNGRQATLATGIRREGTVGQATSPTATENREGISATETGRVVCPARANPRGLP